MITPALLRCPAGFRTVRAADFSLRGRPRGLKPAARVVVVSVIPGEPGTRFLEGAV